ncbi:MAG: DUF1905 domain-containing protein [Thermoleophilia bacterium]|nr:DUF1905 domain-containing protein [Thermoleophilia bacterium]
MQFEFSGTVIEHEGEKASWFFVTLPDDLAQEIARFTKGMRGGWGSVKVDVTIGATSWNTSIFPSGDSFVLPVKKAVRKAEGIGHGSDVEITLSI